MTPHLPAVQAKAPTTLRKRAVRLFSDNTTQPQIIEQFNGIMEPRATLGVRRPGTPTVPNPIPTAASNLIQLGARKKTSTHECQTENFTSSSSDNLSSWDDPVNEKSRINTLGGLCHSPPIRSHGNGRARQASDLRSSMPEADLLPTTSARRPAELKDSVCRRSLNSVLSGLNTPSLLKTCHSMTEGQRSNFVRTCLPPQAPTSRLGLELKKGRKGSSRQEDVHTLCLLHNQFLLWRFVNSKGKVAMKARTITAERSLAQASAVLEELRDSVNEKRVKLENLRRMRTLSNILDVEMPLLDQWSLVDGEYSASLSGAIKSLQDASIRLPIVGDLKIDFRELKDAISSASYLFESLSSSIESFLPTADVVDKVSNNLASVASKEKALLEECGDLLSEVQMLQVKECSLRSLLLQAK
ncbi:hypothetical protein HPP92_020046 [Vanilla planifolia]|uniref:Uncharacterized protein n=1 Tax=Vanilla planifolia TaxID=51239 RepID=A0A835QDN9_VANPL|nr:hypothetical protein HPP92_020046 [Vanilla planifolia]